MSPARRAARPQRKPLGVAADRAAAQPWADALAAGSPIDSVAEEILALGAEASSGVRALGLAAGAKAVPLLGRLAQSDASSVAIAAAEALGDLPETDAAVALEALTHPQVGRPVRDAARRSLHRLSSRGIRAETGPTVLGRLPRAHAATLYRAIASAYDGNGSRAIWLAGDRPLGGIYSIGLTLNDVEGLVDCSGRDTTRKRFAEQENAMRDRDPMAWVELPIEYARQLVQEGLDLAREAGRAAPQQYALWADVIGQPDEPFSRALVYRDVNAFEAKMHPTLLGEAPRLFAQPEIEPWFFEPARLEKWARQLAEPPSQRLVITPETEEGRRERLFREALGEILSPRELHGLRRRLEETAYIFLASDREPDARRAVAAAVTIEEARPLRTPHPFLRALLERSLDIAQRLQRTGFEPVRLTKAPD